MVEILMTWALGESKPYHRLYLPGLKSKPKKMLYVEKLPQTRLSQKDLQKIITRLEEL